MVLVAKCVCFCFCFIIALGIHIQPIPPREGFIMPLQTTVPDSFLIHQRKDTPIVEEAKRKKEEELRLNVEEDKRRRVEENSKAEEANKGKEEVVDIQEKEKEISPRDSLSKLKKIAGFIFNYVDKMAENLGHTANNSDSSQSLESSTIGKTTVSNTKKNISEPVLSDKTVSENESLPTILEGKDETSQTNTVFAPSVTTKDSDSLTKTDKKISEHASNVKTASSTTLHENESLPKMLEGKDDSVPYKAREALQSTTTKHSSSVQYPTQQSELVVNQTTTVSAIVEREPPASSCEANPYGSVCTYILVLSGSLYFRHVMREFA